MELSYFPNYLKLVNKFPRRLKLHYFFLLFKTREVMPFNYSVIISFSTFFPKKTITETNVLKLCFIKDKQHGPKNATLTLFVVY